MACVWRGLAACDKLQNLIAPSEHVAATKEPPPGWGSMPNMWPSCHLSGMDPTKTPHLGPTDQVLLVRSLVREVLARLKLLVNPNQTSRGTLWVENLKLLLEWTYRPFQAYKRSSSLAHHCQTLSKQRREVLIDDLVFAYELLLSHVCAVSWQSKLAANIWNGSPRRWALLLESLPLSCWNYVLFWTGLNFQGELDSALDHIICNVEAIWADRILVCSLLSKRDFSRTQIS